MLALAVTGTIAIWPNSKDLDDTNQDQNLLLADLIIKTTDQRYTLNFNQGENLFNALLALDQREDNFEMQYKESNFGAYITSINGNEPDSSKAYWKIVINGADAMVGAKDYLLQANDQIQFEIEEIK